MTNNAPAHAFNASSELALLKPKHGFALVVTLSMLVLLTIIAVGLLSLSSIAFKNNSINKAQQEAEANARMALMIAIGELQNHMGPDQRVSMTADQRIEDNSDGSVTSTAEGNRFWTGVYDAWPATAELRPDSSSSFRSWLVSGASNLVSEENTSDVELSLDESVEMVGAGTLGTDNLNNRVRVPLVDVQAASNQPGRMAWWVGDQGVKAALSTPPPAMDSSLELTRNNLSSAPRNAHELVSLEDGTTKPFEGVAPVDERLRKMLSWPQAALLSSDPDAPGPLFHDMAAHSSGLLTNVRDGGFRKDLSMQMEHHTVAPDLTDPSNILYTARSNVTGNDEAGINFMELWAYYHLYKQLLYDGDLTYTTGAGMPGSAAYLQTKESIEGPDGVVEDNWDMFKHPLVVNYEMLLSFEVYPYDIIGHRTTTNPVLRNGDPVFDNNGNQLFNDEVYVERTINGLFINHDAIITLWNPLDVAVHIKSFRPSQSFGTHPRKNCYLFFYPSFPYNLDLRKSDGSNIRCPLSRVTNSSICMDVGRVERVDRDDPIILKPGEVVMFSQVGSNNNSQSGRIEVPYYAAGFSDLRLFGGKGFNFGGGMSAVARDDNYVNPVYQAGVRPNRNTGEIRPRATSAGNPIELDPGESFSYSLEPNGDRHRGGSGGNSLIGWSYMVGNPWGRHMRGLSTYGMATIDHDWGYSRGQQGETPADRQRIRNPFNLTPLDAGVSDLFPTFDDPRTTQRLSHARLAADKVPFMSISLRAKTEMDGQRGTKALARLNPKAHFLNYWDMSPKERDMLPYELQIRPVTSFLDSGLAEVMPNGRAYFGSGTSGQFGSGFVATHAVPRQPLISMASFQHSFANGFNRLPTSGLTGYPDRSRPERHTRLARHPLLPQISHAIGNSLAPSVLPPDQIRHEPGSGDSNPHPLADHSYLANLELWDAYFLSGIAPQPAPAFDDPRDQETVAQEFFEDGISLPVARYLADTGGQDATELATSFFSGGIPTEESINLVASHLRVDGMFNVNSTSVEAWKAMLGSLKGRPIVVRSEDGEESIASVDDTPVASMMAPSNAVIEDRAASAPDRNSYWDGRRELSDEEIDGLARAIVMEVRKRGPFLSLADFINRRVGDDVELARAGAIQSALDSDAVEINSDQNSGRAVAPSVAGRMDFPEAEEGAIHYGAPSLVKQADVLTPIAPVLSARSDSFIIRAYGESLDSSGRVVARAWCEAVVERTRDYVDSADGPQVMPTDLTESANQTFGRRFKMISFRWLNSTEV